MPQVFDNIDQSLLPALQGALRLSDRADLWVGYFNLRGWKELDHHIQHWSEMDGACRLLVGMQKNLLLSSGNILKYRLCEETIGLESLFVRFHHGMAA